MGATKSGIGPFEGLDHASPEPSLGQGQPTPEDLCLTRGPPPATNILPARPRPSLRQEATLAKSPRQPTKIAGAFNAKVAWHLYPDARPPVDRAEVTAVTSPLHWPAWQKDSVACAAPTAVPLDRVRLTGSQARPQAP
jgi:hypothetical protein